MKKWIVLFTLIMCISFQSNTEAKVIWDGAEITKGQTGKLTFSKDVKIYKKSDDGTFISLVVKKGEFYRVYGHEYSTVGKVYKMSGGYRVQATDLVIYKEVPLAIQQQVSGVKFTVGTPIFANSAKGVSIKEAPNSAAKTILHTPYGAVFKVVELSGDYVKVEYNPRTDTTIDYIWGYVPQDYVSNLPEGTIQYVNQIVDLSVRPGWQSQSLKPGTSVAVYFTTADGRAYVSSNKIYGYLPVSALSKTPIVDKELQVLAEPSSLLFDATKKIALSETAPYYYLTEFSPTSSNRWQGKMQLVNDDEISGGKQIAGALSYTLINKKLTYHLESELHDQKIMMQFPLKVNDTIYVNGQTQKVSKIYEQYALNITGSYKTFTNVVIAGDYIIAKGLVKGPYNYWIQS
ncbi:hypothetical protein ACIQXW_16650 [Lysinibacillus sp. NPDC097162]|uniref:hypothetical protein n=1 Tax=Lysinibacillus sp. NPDC097162 TaxID=3364140 RepID=UPI00380A0804